MKVRAYHSLRGQKRLYLVVRVSYYHRGKGLVVKTLNLEVKYVFQLQAYINT